MSVWLWGLLLIVVVVCGIYVRAVVRRALHEREPFADYFSIRRLERELGMRLTPFPDWLADVRPPASVVLDLHLSGPVVSFAEAAEAYERAVLAGKVPDLDGFILPRAVSSSAPPESR